MKPLLWNLSASELASKVASGETSALEVIENHLQRIELVNPEFNGIVNVLEDSALEAAKEVDRRQAFADFALKKFSKIDVIINNAASCRFPPSPNSKSTSGTA